MGLTTLLILADMVESTKALSSVFVFVGGIAFLFLVAMWGINSSELSQYINEKDLDRYAFAIAKHKKYIKISWGLLKLLIPIMILSVLLSIGLPSKKTLYIIAGLKAADRVINSEIGKKTQELLFKKIETYLDEATEKEKTK